MELDRNDIRREIDVMQNDQYSRELELYLKSNGKEYCPPEDCVVLVRYKKPNGQSGAYDTMPDGRKAWEIRGSTVTVGIVPQICTVVGRVMLTVTLRCQEKELKMISYPTDDGFPNLCITVNNTDVSYEEYTETYEAKMAVLPVVTEADNGKVLKVVDGKWIAVAD